MEHADPAPARAFSWQSRADGTIVIRWGVAPVTVLRGRTAERFTARMATADGAAAQLLMARATGNFKRGNEREARRRGR
ncbi:MAG TPA: hypothetical protein VF364_11765 [Candidatus Limnocylindria bacterium]